MARAILNEILSPLSECSTQAYLDNRIQLFDIMEFILQEIGQADIYVTTFSSSEEFLRKIFRLRKNGMIRRAVMVTDFKAINKTRQLHRFIAGVFDEVYLSANHSKVVLFAGERRQVSVITSQNQTRGNRNESGIITTDRRVFNSLYASIDKLINSNSISINELLKTTT